MRVAVVPDEHFTDELGTGIVESLRKIFPQPIGGVEEAELVISTSGAAARSVENSPGRLHLCYLTQCEESAATLQISPNSARHTASRDARSGVSQQTAFSLPFARPVSAWQSAHVGITHFLAGNGVVAARLKQEHGRPVKVIYPPVETHDFRPDSGQRSDFYLTTAHPGELAELTLAVEAARIAKRRLVVIADKSSEMTHYFHDQAHLQFVESAPIEEKRRSLCECRAYLCPRAADFDVDVVRAQACGTPVIVFAGCGISELIADAEGDGPGTGLFFEEPTPQSLAEAMFELERRPQKFSAPIAWARAKNFSFSRFEREISGFIEQLLAASVMAHAAQSSPNYDFADDVDRSAA